MATNIFDKLSTGVVTKSAAGTRALGRALAAELPPDCTLALHGDLGSGKTTFVSGLAEGWGIPGPVTSPTFNLLVIHRGGRMLAHLDAYRLKSAEDLDALMLDEFLKSPWCLAVEWPENVAGALPENALHLFLADLGDGRRSIRLAEGRSVVAKTPEDR
jgi:tRNA threonylcarbamoyladenosine biosynthesis protein TsaE